MAKKDKGIWISYDLGLKGDYNSLYTWLDSKGAKECGDSVAFFYVNDYEGESIKEMLKNEIAESVALSSTDRIYIIYKNDDTNKTKGSYIFGGRKRAPWEGFAVGKATDDDLGS